MIEYLTEFTEAIRRTNWFQVDFLVDAVKRNRAMGKTMFVCGNGGSFAVALHWGVDLVKIGHVNTYVLGTNGSLSSALSNDIDYEVALSSELVTRAHPEDLVVALSCSGTSRNVQRVLRDALRMHIEPFLITSYRNRPEPISLGVKTIEIHSERYDILEDVFSAIGHYITREIS